MIVSTRRMLKEAQTFMEKYGIRIVNYEEHRKHRKVWVTDGIKTAFIFVSVSPSCPRTLQNIAQSARQALREAR